MFLVFGGNGVAMKLICWICLIRNKCRPTTKGWIEHRFVKYAACMWGGKRVR